MKKGLGGIWDLFIFNFLGCFYGCYALYFDRAGEFCVWDVLFLGW